MSDLIPVAIVVRKQGVFLPQLGIGTETVEERYVVYAFPDSNPEPDEIDRALEEEFNGIAKSTERESQVHTSDAETRPPPDSDQPALDS